MRKIKKFTTAAIALSLALTLAACSSGGAASASSTASAGSSTAADAGSTPAQASGDGTYSVTYLTDQAQQSLDRYGAVGSMASHTLGMIWGDSLISSDRAGTFEPWLATEWEMAEDSMSITMKLREGITFSNGDPFTSKDVAFTWERLRDDESLTSDAAKWRPYIGTIETPDDYTITLNFASIMPTFFTEAAWLPILSKTAYEELGAEGFWSNPVGTGPYTVLKWDAVNSIGEFEQRPDWWGYDHTGRSSNVGHITYKLVSESTTRVSSLRSGEVQIVEAVPDESIEVLKQEGFNVNQFERLEHMFLQTHSGPGTIFEDRNLREALSLCIDRELLVSSILGGGSAATWPVHPGSSGYRETDGYEYNPERAKELVEASDYNGEPINFICTSSKIVRGNEITQAIQSMAQEVGLNLTIEMLEDAVYNERREASNYDLVFASYTGSGNEFYNQIRDIFGSDRFKTEYQNEKLKELCTAVSTTADPTEQDLLRAAVYEEVMSSFDGGIYLYQPLGCFAWVSGLDGVTVYKDAVADYRFMNVTE